MLVMALSIMLVLCAVLKGANPKSSFDVTKAICPRDERYAY